MQQDLNSNLKEFLNNKNKKRPDQTQQQPRLNLKNPGKETKGQTRKQ